MPGFEVILTLTEDCVFSHRAATVGAHSSLDYIPGAALLGAAAAKLYPQLSNIEAFTLFHSGQVRFGNGLPLSAHNEPTWPMPLCWHYGKGEIFKDNKADTDALNGTPPRLLADKLWRLGDNVELPNRQQPQQIREDYVTRTGHIVKPARAMRMKTAIDFTTGTAKNAALFGYESLNAGQRFIARISSDATVPSALLDKLRPIFSSTVILGRSRSAEYGGVMAKVQDLSSIPNSTTTDNTITIWLLSDLAAMDPWGQPTLTPLPQWLGLPEGNMVLEKTFLRTRRYSPWNAHRRAPDLERQIICQGSVLVFDLKHGLTPQHKERIATGLGAYREVGLGQVWLNPDWLGTIGGHPNFTTRLVSPSAQEALPTTSLMQWLDTSKNNQNIRGDQARQARILARNYRELLSSARHLKGLRDNVAIGPSPSQWGSVLAAAKTAATDATLKSVLFDGNSCVCKSSMPGWKDEYWNEDAKSMLSFRSWLEDIVVKYDAERKFIQILAREIMHVVRQDGRSNVDYEQ